MLSMSVCVCISVRLTSFISVKLFMWIRRDIRGDMEDDICAYNLERERARVPALVWWFQKSDIEKLNMAQTHIYTIDRACTWCYGCVVSFFLYLLDKYFNLSTFCLFIVVSLAWLLAAVCALSLYLSVSFSVWRCFCKFFPYSRSLINYSAPTSLLNAPKREQNKRKPAACVSRRKHINICMHSPRPNVHSEVIIIIFRISFLLFFVETKRKGRTKKLRMEKKNERLRCSRDHFAKISTKERQSGERVII